MESMRVQSISLDDRGFSDSLIPPKGTIAISRNFGAFLVSDGVTNINEVQPYMGSGPSPGSGGNK